MASTPSTAHSPSSPHIHAALRNALDAEVLQGLRPVTVGLTALYILFAVGHALFLPRGVAVKMSIMAALTALLLVGLYYVLRRWAIPAHWSHWIGAGMAGLILINSLLHLFLQSEPEQTTNVALLVIGVGCFFLSTRWLALVLSVSLAGWLVVVSFSPGPVTLWRHFGFMLLAATVLSVLVHTVRVRTFRQLELMLILDEGRKLELEEALQSLQQSRERFRQLSEATFEGVAVHEQGELSDANQTLARMFGYSLDEIAGSSVLQLVAPESRAAVNEQILSGYEKPFEALGNRKDGTLFPVEICCKAISHDERVISVMAIRDISERKRVDAEHAQLIREQTARIEAESANRIKDQFLTTLSHELRTPLTAILGWAHMLRAMPLDEESRQRGLEVIERKAREQSQLIDELLDVSRIVTGKLRLEMRLIELTSVLRMAVDAARPAADAKSINLQSRLEAQPCFVSGDPDRLQQVLWNLLSNAVKFTANGGSILVQLESTRSRARIIVRDTGIGISPDFLPHVFDRFRQADSSTTRSHGGLGLGLAIVSHLVELHGGTVYADSEGESKGATFTVELPLTLSREEGGPSSETSDALSMNGDSASLERPSALKGLRVLVVDDEPDTLEMLAVILRGHGAEVRQSISTAEALSVLDQWRPDVLVSDIGMPGEDGFALIRRVRALEEHNGGRIPALAVTAYARAEDRARTLAAGYQMHVVKPIEPEKLAAAVASVARQIVKV